MIYLIPENRMEDLKKKFNKLNKKSNIFSLKELGTEYKKVEVYNEEIVKGRKELVFKRDTIIKCIKVEVSGFYKVNDFEFIATLQHLDNSNVVRNISEFVIPNKFRTCGPTCEHCNKIRSRKDTYLVRNSKTGEIKQVGKSCLKDYTGLDLDIITSRLEIDAIINELSNFDNLDESCFPKEINWFNNIEIKKFAYYYLKRNGYTPIKTRNEFYDYYLNYNGDGLEDCSKQIDEISKWIDNQVNKNPNNNYYNNCKAIFNTDYIEYKNLSYLLSCMYKAITSIESKSEFQGNIGDKIQVNINDLKVLYSDNSYADTSYCYSIYDEGKNSIFIWKTTKELKVGEIYQATIKGHKEYNGTKQTIIIRGKRLLN